MNRRSTIQMFLLSCAITALLAGLGGCSGKDKPDPSGANRTGTPGMPNTGGGVTAAPTDNSKGK